MADYKRGEMKVFVNPYNFVTINRGRDSRQDITDKGFKTEERHTGYLQCRLFVKTPLAVPDTAPEKRVADPDVKDHFHYPFYSVYNGQPVIPGSSIRGVLRSVYEAATDSCMVTAKDNMGMTARINNRDAYKSGLLVWEDEEWKLYRAKRYVVLIKGYRRFQDKRQSFRVKTAKNGCYIEDERGNKFYHGQCVEFELFSDPQPYRKGNFVIWDGVVESMKPSEKSLKGAYLYIGEKFGNKHGESIFQKAGYVNERKEKIEAALEGMEETLKIYRDSAVNRSYHKEHSGYENYEKAKESGVIPVWFKQDEGKLYFSAAAIGRMQYENRLVDLIGKKAPCKTRSALCSACALFGMIGKEAAGSRIRISDAEGKKYEMKSATLKELGMPRSSYMPFYAERINGRRVEECKSYDDDGAAIRGRKFYWHNPAAEKDAFIYTVSSEKDKTERNATLELVMPGAEFDFRIYYDEITNKQLEQLIWAVTFWENEENGELCHKLGHGKPLGLGSVKMVVTERVERSIDKDGYHMETTEISLGDVPVNSTSLEVRELLKICNFHAMEGKTICYPYVELGEHAKEQMEQEYAGRKLGDNVLASHQWFTHNKGTRRDAPSPCRLATILEEDHGLPVYYVERLENRDMDRNNQMPAAGRRTANSHSEGRNAAEEVSASRGTVKFFNQAKNYGFIVMEDGKEVFVGGNSVDEQSISKMKTGTKVTFDVIQRQKGPEARNCHVTEE